MGESRLRGFVNTLNMEAEKLGLDDIQVSRIERDRERLSEEVSEILGENQACIIIGVKRDYPVYPPGTPRMGFFVDEDGSDGSLHSVYQRASAFLQGIALARRIAKANNQEANLVSE